MRRRTREPPQPPLPPEDTPSEEEVVELPVDGNLDLHLFHPRDVKELVTEYLWACRQKGLLDVRIIHDGGWGATWVRLKAP